MKDMRILNEFLSYRSFFYHHTEFATWFARMNQIDVGAACDFHMTNLLTLQLCHETS